MENARCAYIEVSMAWRRVIGRLENPHDYLGGKRCRLLLRGSSARAKEACNKPSQAELDVKSPAPVSMPQRDFLGRD